MNTTIHEPARDIPVAHQCDVCVVGGSCTGVFAAVAAARLGARVALIERLGLFGGTATASMVNIWHSISDLPGRRAIIGGLTAEVVERLTRRGAVEDRGNNPHAQYILNSAELAIELDELVAEAGIRPFLHAVFAAPVVEGGRIAAAIIEDKSGRRAIRAGQFIDATGDGDLLARAGFAHGELADPQPPTACAPIRGLDDIRAANPGFDLGGAISDPRYPESLPRGFAWDAPVPGVPGMRMAAATRVPGARCADADELTRAEMEGRRQIRAMCDILRRHVRGGAEAALVAVPARIGIRETRHAECLHRLSEDEVLRGVRFDDAIANGTYRVDVHHSDKPGLTFRYLDGREVYVVPGRPAVTTRWCPEGKPTADFYQIPYRSLVPKGSENLLVCGRLIDADRGAYGAIRVMVNCNQTGQAAGVAAWLALSRNVGVAGVPHEELRRVLAAQGAITI
jgi:hypothetical protein